MVMPLRACFVLTVLAEAAAIGGESVGQLLGGLRSSDGHAVVVLKVPLPAGPLGDNDYQQACAGASAKPVCQGGPSCSHDGLLDCTSLVIEADYCGYPMMGLAKQLGFQNPGSQFFSNICINPGPGWNFKDGTCGGGLHRSPVYPRFVAPRPSFYTHADSVVGRRYTLCAASALTRQDGAFLPEEGACEVSGDCITSPGFPRQHLNNDFCTITVLQSGTLSAPMFVAGPGAGTLSVAGFQYRGFSALNGTIVKSGDVIVWRAHRLATTSGWKVCLQAFPSKADGGEFQDGDESFPSDEDAKKRPTSPASADSGVSQPGKTLQDELQKSRAQQEKEEEDEQEELKAEEEEVAAEAKAREYHNEEEQHLRQQEAESQADHQAFNTSQVHVPFWTRIRHFLLIGIGFLFLFCLDRRRDDGTQIGMSSLVQPLLVVEDPEHQRSTAASRCSNESFEPKISIVEYQDASGQAAKCIRIEVPGRELFSGRRNIKGTVQELGSGLRLTIIKEADMPRDASSNFGLTERATTETHRTWERTVSFGEGCWSIVGPEGPAGLGDFDRHGIWEVHVAQTAMTLLPGNATLRTFTVCPFHDLAEADRPSEAPDHAEDTQLPSDSTSWLEASPNLPFLLCDDYTHVTSVDLPDVVPADASSKECPDIDQQAAEPEHIESLRRLSPSLWPAPAPAVATASADLADASTEFAAEASADDDERAAATEDQMTPEHNATTEDQTPEARPRSATNDSVHTAASWEPVDVDGIDYTVVEEENHADGETPLTVTE